MCSRTGWVVPGFSFAKGVAVSSIRGWICSVVERIALGAMVRRGASGPSEPGDPSKPWGQDDGPSAIAGAEGMIAREMNEATTTERVKPFLMRYITRR